MIVTIILAQKQSRNVISVRMVGSHGQRGSGGGIDAQQRSFGLLLPVCDGGHDQERHGLRGDAQH